MTATLAFTVFGFFGIAYFLFGLRLAVTYVRVAPQPLYVRDVLWLALYWGPFGASLIRHALRRGVLPIRPSQRTPQTVRLLPP